MDCAAITSAHTGGKLSRMLINRPEVADAPAELMDNLESKDGPGPPLVTQSTTPTTEVIFGAVRHGDVDNDPVNLPHLLDMSLTLVTNAAANGLPAEHIEEIRKLEHEFHDVGAFHLLQGRQQSYHQWSSSYFPMLHRCAVNSGATRRNSALSLRALLIG
jgi:hypothetical protein